MKSRELALIALRILSGWTMRRAGNPEEIEILRAHALEGERDLPPDELACRIVGRECAKVIAQSQGERKAMSRNFRHEKTA